MDNNKNKPEYTEEERQQILENIREMRKTGNIMIASIIISSVAIIISLIFHVFAKIIH